MVAACRDEALPFAIGHAAIGQREGAQQDLMAWTFRVEAKAFPTFPDFDDAAFEFGPFLLVRARRSIIAFRG